MRALRRVHAVGYLESLQNPQTVLSVIGYPLPPGEFERVLDLHRLLTGGTIAAIDRAIGEGGCQIHLGGGFHHASRDAGQGFCIFNDVAVGIARARDDGFAGPVLVLDLDLHDGDGTRRMFADDASVHTLSIHNRTLDASAAVESTTVELGSAVGDDEYLAAVATHVPAILEAFRPELVIYLAGTDPAEDDTLGDWRVSAGGMLRRDRAVVESIDRLTPDAARVVLLAGGYGPNAWTYSARFFAGLLRPGKRPPEPGDGRVDERGERRLKRWLSDRTAANERSADWGLTEEDLLGSLRPAARPERFLNYYTRHGIEVALEQYGFLELLREKGFRRPRVELELTDAYVHGLRIFPEGRDDEPLVELRLRRDSRSLPGAELLSIEWLLLQNPRAEFDAERPPLPGQRRPGLGLAAEATQLIATLCRRLELDGMTFTPAHYHIAAIAAPHMGFLEAEAEARFRAMRAVLGGLPLAAATAAVDAGRLVRADTGEPYPWQPSPMVLALSDRLQRTHARADRAAEIRRAAESIPVLELLDA